MPTEDSPPPFLRILLGPTASGKETVAVTCAQSLNGEIISVDSMKLYRDLHIGTASPSSTALATVPHHCVNFLSPSASFDVAQYVEKSSAAIQQIVRAQKVPILSGGTALYYKGLLEGIFAGPPADAAVREALQKRLETEGGAVLHAELAQADPAAAAKIHPNDQRRLVRALEVLKVTGVPLGEQQKEWQSHRPHLAPKTTVAPTWDFRYPCSLVGLAWSRPILYARIEKRVDRMLAAGLLKEARWVYENRPTVSRTLLQAVGYKEFFAHFSGEISQAEAVTLLKRNTRHLAKSQMTWFRKFPCKWVEMTEERDHDEVAREVRAVWDAEREIQGA